MKRKEDGNIIVTNRKARRDFHVLDTYEAGIELQGTEVKSLRDKRGNLNDSFARIVNGQLYLFNLHISPYEFGNINNHEPLRNRRLLLHRAEISKLSGQTNMKGYALIPLKLYFKGGKVKVELAVAKGKTQYDKRQTIKEKEAQMEMKKAARARIDR